MLSSHLQHQSLSPPRWWPDIEALTTTLLANVRLINFRLICTQKCNKMFKKRQNKNFQSFVQTQGWIIFTSKQGLSLKLSKSRIKQYSQMSLLVWTMFNEIYCFFLCNPLLFYIGDSSWRQSPSHHLWHKHRGAHVCGCWQQRK